MIEAFAEGAVADLVMILKAVEKVLGGGKAQGVAPPACAQGGDEVIDGASVTGIVAGLFATERDVDVVMEIVGVDGVEGIAAGGCGLDKFGVVGFVFGDDQEGAVGGREARTARASSAMM